MDEKCERIALVLPMKNMRKMKTKMLSSRWEQEVRRLVNEDAEN